MRAGETRRIVTAAWAAVLLLPAAAGLAAAAGAGDAAAPAREVLSAAGVQGGLVVHLGCGDGRLTASLRADERFLVHGLDADGANVVRAREHVRKLGLCGAVAVDRLAGRTLPYVDNLVNLLVAEDLGDVPMAEVLRVLCPGGVACIRKGAQWARTVKPRPADIDEWTHFLHDATGNAVARDTQVGPPRHMQWLADPSWCRNHHKLASISAVVAAEGRIFYIMDEGPAASMDVPGKWFLVARDAFNGMLLWKQPMASWAYTLHGFRSGPVQLPRTLVAGAGCAYAPLEMSAPVSAVDAATGKVLRTYRGTEGAEEIVLDDDVLLVLAGTPLAEQALIDPARRGEGRHPNVKTVHAIRAATGETLWKWSRGEAANPVPLTLAADGGRVFFQSGRGVVCLDRRTGEQLWGPGAAGASGPAGADDDQGATGPEGAGKGRKADKVGKAADPAKTAAARGVGWSSSTLVVSGEVVLLADGGRLAAMSVRDGKALWDCPCKAGFRSPSDVFVAAGLVWIGPDFSEGRDLRTGEVRKQNIAASDVWTVGHHHRCYREKATERYILTGKRGIEFLDLAGADHARCNWIRGVCQYGVMPCNGLVYAPSHACGCFMEAKLYGFWAAAPKRQAPATEGGPQLEKGPAYERVRDPQPAARNPEDWPMQRHDALRSGSATTEVPARLKAAWRANVGGRLTQPVIAEGAVVVASTDEHRVVAMDAADGKVRWSRTVGGRVDSTPTIHEGTALFGCADGWVYCLRLADGELAWRFRAAPEERNTVAYDRVESVWPVHGSILVQDGVAYAAAGRSSYLDGGIAVYGLDPASGKVLSQSRLCTPHPTPGKPAAGEAPANAAQKIGQNATDARTFTDPDRSDAFSMGGAITDILVSDGQSVYMRQVRFDRKCVEQPQGGRHLFSTSSLLDDAEVHRSHWVLGTGDFSRIPVAYSWIADSGGGRFGSRLDRPYGLMMAFDDHTVWGVRRGRQYTLFAQDNRPFSPDEPARPDFQKPDAAPAPAWRWSAGLGLRPRALLRSGDVLVAGGMTESLDANDPHAAYEGRKGGLLVTFSARDGAKLGEHRLDSPPVWDGLAAAQRRVYVSTMAGHVLCLELDESPPPVAPQPAATATPAPAAPPKQPAAKAARRGEPSGDQGRPGAPVGPEPDGRIVLRPETARTTGGLRYQADRDNLGSWNNPADYCEWRLRDVPAGTYAVEFAYGSIQPGIEYAIVAGDRKLTGKTQDTGGIREYKAFPVGTIALPAGEVTLAVKPGRFTGAIMNFRLLTLTPAKQ